MTTFPRKFSTVVSHIKDGIFLATLIVAISTAVGSAIFSFTWPYFIERLKQDLDVITKDDLVEIRQTLDLLSGEHRLVRMPAGHSYVEEPVGQGDLVSLNMILSSTKRGSECTFTGIIPIFKDGRDIPYAGMATTPFRQLSASPERLNLRLTPPDNLEPGRVGVALNLRFSCPFGANGALIDVFDETDFVFFQLDPAVK